MQKLRMHISGEWWSRDFHTLFRDIEVIAKLAETNKTSFDLDGDWDIDSRIPVQVRDAPGSGNTEGNRRIQITRLSFASPGFTDLAGVGKILEQLRLFCEFCITKVLERNDRKLENEEKKLRLEVLRQHLLASPLPEGLQPHMKDFLKSPQADSFVRSIAEGRLNSIESIDDDDDL